MPVICILATDISGGIAKDGVIPWHIPQDLKLFRILTTNQVVIMGRKTFESLPENVRPLPNRTNIVISKNCNIHPNVQCMTIDTVTDYIKCNGQNETLFIIGGAELINSLYDYIDGYVLTIVHGLYQCDTRIELDKIRFYDTKIIYDSKDIDYKDIVYHIEVRSRHNENFKTLCDNIEKILIHT